MGNVCSTEERDILAMAGEGRANVAVRIAAFAGLLCLAFLFALAARPQQAMAVTADDVRHMSMAEIKALSADERAEVQDEVWIGPLPSHPDFANGAVTLSGEAGEMHVQAGTDMAIRNANDLQSFASQVNAGTDFSGCTVSLERDLIITSGTWVPAGTQAHPFNGLFQGNGHFIQNLTVAAPLNLRYAGFIGYAGDQASIMNLELRGGSLSVSNAAAGKTISDIGAIAGHLGGSIGGCTSTMPVSVTNNGAIVLPPNTSELQGSIIMNIGGLVGSLGGSMADCTHGAALAVASKSNVVDGCTAIGGYIGGLVGLQGDPSDLGSAADISGCTNTGALNFTVSGSGGYDRFGEQLYSKTGMVGGIAGYTMGSVRNCVNTADLNTGLTKDGSVQSGYGASTAGGIVGSLRSTTFRNSFIEVTQSQVGAATSDPAYEAWQKSAPVKPTEARIENCRNSGKVTGLAVCGGICGSAGAFSAISGCANTGMVEGTRWNKPTPGGIVGVTNGNVAYCYNQARVWSTTGGGFYASGIAGMLTTYNQGSTPAVQIMDVPEMYGCYVTAPIGGSLSGYRTAVLAGENEGYIHDNCFLPNLVADKSANADVFGDNNKHSNLVGTDQNSGTLSRNHELSADQMKSGLAVSFLNRVASLRGDWSVCYVPVAGQFPLLAWQQPDQAAVPLEQVVTGADAAQLAGGDPAYSSVAAPVPQITVTADDGTVLYQDCDFKVITDPAADVGTDAGSTVYTAHIQGINAYSGILSQTVPYKIAKAQVSDCTITAGSRMFNWEQQEPAWVKLVDEAGNEVPAAEYEWSVPQGDPDDASIKAGGKYYDYVNVHSASYRYDVTVKAKESSVNYTGQDTQAAFRITYASLSYQPDNQGKPGAVETAVLGDVSYAGQTFSVDKAIKEPGSFKCTYTGQEIRPTVEGVTYKGHDLRDGTGKDYWTPLKYDYRYIYGNPNPSSTQEGDIAGVNVDATGTNVSDLACMTLRWVSGGNFDNYTNVFFEIVPASIADDVTVAGVSPSYSFTGSAVKPTPTLTYNGMTLEAGTDYTLSYGANTLPGTGWVTITGKGNYSGSRTCTFSIVFGSAVSIASGVEVTGVGSSYAYSGKAIAPVPKLTYKGITLKANTDYTVGYRNNINAGTATLTITGKGNFKDTKSIAYRITKVANPLQVSAKTATVKYKKVKKAKQTLKVAKVLAVSKAQGAVTYKKSSGNKKITVAKNGKVTVKKGLKKGIYKIKVKVTAAGNANYNALTKTVTFKVKIK